MSTFFERAKKKTAMAQGSSVAKPNTPFSFASGASAKELGIPDFESSSDDHGPNTAVAPSRTSTSSAPPPRGIPTARPMFTPQSKSAAPSPSSSAGAIPRPGAARFNFNKPAASSNTQASLPIDAPDELVGLLTDVRLYNDWGIGKVMDERGRRVSVKGSALMTLQEGNRYRFAGRRSEHPKYGAQFEIIHVQPDIDSIEAIVSHIQRNYKGVGMQTATRFVQHHRENGTLNSLKHKLIHEPSSVDFSGFTKREVSLRDDEDSQERRVRDSLSIRFSGMGIDRNVITGLASYLLLQSTDPNLKGKFPGKDRVSLCNMILDENPYMAIGQVERYGFKTADLIAKQVGIQKDDPRRMCALAGYALKEGSVNNGHTWLEGGSLYEAIRRLDSQVDAVKAIEMAIEDGRYIYVDESFDSPRYYVPELYRAEKRLAEHLAMRLTNEVEPLYKGDPSLLPDLIKQAALRVGKRKGVENYTLDESQVKALTGILTSTCSIHTLTAGPGCGKTTIVEVLMETLNGGRSLDAIFCAPTGKAAKVLNSRIGQWGVAQTIHSTLEFNGQWQRNRDNPLETRFVVADEQSMLGTGLGYRFFDAIPAKAHVLMLGDPQQLDPIDAGNVLKAALRLEGLDHHRLTKTHRNDGELLDVINEVGNGYCDARSRKDVTFIGELPAPTGPAFSALARQVQEAAEQYGGLARVGVICPKRRGSTNTPDWNVTYLNHVLRDAINPDDAHGSKKIAGTNFRLNDRIIITKNMQVDGVKKIKAAASRKAPSASVAAILDELGAELCNDGDNPFETNDEEREITVQVSVVNGDTGNIVDVEYDPEVSHKRVKNLVLKLDDDRTVYFPLAELDNLSLSYAITVHAAQGSEYSKVFAINTDGHESFMYRSMMFTQFSRAQSELVVYGDPKVLAKVASRPAPHRNCALVEQTLKEVEQIVHQEMSEQTVARPREVA